MFKDAFKDLEWLIYTHWIHCVGSMNIGGILVLLMAKLVISGNPCLSKKVLNSSLGIDEKSQLVINRLQADQPICHRESVSDLDHFISR